MTRKPEQSKDEASEPAVLALRDERGRLLPGARLNPSGREKGSQNATTVAAARELKAHAKLAADTLVSILRDPNANLWLQAQVAVQLLQRVLPSGDLDFDEGWIEYTTAEEAAQLVAIVDAAKERMRDGGQPPTREDDFPPRPQHVIDIAAEPVPEPQQDDDSEEFTP